VTKTESEVDALIADLDHHDKPTIRAAVDALLPLAGQSADLRALLRERLTQPEKKNYWPVAYILGQLPSPDNTVVRVLLDALDHQEPDIRWAVALLLVRLAKNDDNHIAHLIELSANGTANQKRMALYCIRDLSLRDSTSLAALLNGLRDADPTVRVAAAICLKQRADLNDNDKSLLLKTYLEDTDSRVRNAAAIVLADLGSPSEEFVVALREASESDNREHKKTADAALELLKKRRSASSDSRSGR
jgi:HEAT repeat protein